MFALVITVIVLIAFVVMLSQTFEPTTYKRTPAAPRVRTEPLVEPHHTYGWAPDMCVRRGCTDKHLPDSAYCFDHDYAAYGAAH
jgi:hypothetical protein